MNSFRTAQLNKFSSGIGAAIQCSLKSFAQIYCQSSAWFGAGLLLALSMSGATLAVAGCAGMAIANGCALALRARRADLADGVYGYNAALCSVGLAATYQADTGLLLWIAAAGLACAMATHAFLRWGRLPALTLPFVAIMLLAAWLAPLTGLHLLANGGKAYYSLPVFAFHAWAQICFIDSPALGMLLLAALAWQRWHSAIAALCAALLAWGLAAAGAGIWPMDVHPHLTGIALNCMLSAVCLTANRRSRPVCLLGMAVTAGLGLVCAVLDLHLFTLPFVAASWVILQATKADGQLPAAQSRRSPQRSPTT
ncbi:urea transporter [Undibacterium sp.]|jgi:urea transporter|uniref:urea transporter n=1 Tax=Undibacterium sp. TaxID=1914977 RepID=UPI002CFF70F6|nr:urea transporter [Undibacterium sp.]HTD04536.1 urea transporter [Undibacterium sp.]